MHCLFQIEPMSYKRWEVSRPSLSTPSSAPRPSHLGRASSGRKLLVSISILTSGLCGLSRMCTDTWAYRVRGEHEIQVCGSPFLSAREGTDHLCRKLTNAQRSGLNQIPNRRFTLWWSPTINRYACTSSRHADSLTDISQGQCVCRLSSATRSHWHLLARQDPDPQDLAHPDFPRSFVAEDPRECGHGLVPSL